MYYITLDGNIRDEIKNIIIPDDINNRDRVEYQKWLDAGNIPQTDAIQLIDYKTTAKFVIENESETKKLEFITYGSGKAMAYTDKYEEAVDHKAAGYPTNLAPYPYINQESTLTGDSGQIVTDRIIAAKTLCVDKFSQIEAITFTGKRDIDAALDESNVDSIKDATIISIKAI